MVGGGWFYFYNARRRASPERHNAVQLGAVSAPLGQAKESCSSFLKHPALVYGMMIILAPGALLAQRPATFAAQLLFLLWTQIEIGLVAAQANHWTIALWTHGKR